MMEARELRIGNLILYKGGVIPVTMIGEYGIQSKTKDWLINAKFATPDLEPVELNRGWLTKFGWVWNENLEFYEKYPNGDPRLNLEFKKGSGSYVMFNYILKALVCERIWYVHQLQNLYFELTRKDFETEN